MKRTTLHFMVDLTSFLDLLLLAATGAILKWVLPPGSGGGHGFRGGRGLAAETQDFASLGRHDWGDVHFILALLFLFLMLLHLYLHWTWIKTCGRWILVPSRGALYTPEDESGRA